MGLVRGLPSSKIPIQQAAMMRPSASATSAMGERCSCMAMLKARTEIGGFDVASVAQRVAPQLVVDGGDAGQVIERGGTQELRCQGSWGLLPSWVRPPLSVTWTQDGRIDHSAGEPRILGDGGS